MFRKFFKIVILALIIDLSALNKKSLFTLLLSDNSLMFQRLRDKRLFFVRSDHTNTNFEKNFTISVGKRIFYRKLSRAHSFHP